MRDGRKVIVPIVLTPDGGPAQDAIWIIDQLF